MTANEPDAFSIQFRAHDSKHNIGSGTVVGRPGDTTQPGESGPQPFGAIIHSHN